MAAALERTPMCEVTGLPLPILPKEPPSNGAPFSSQKNYHHHFHPAYSPHLKTISGLAVRSSRVQHVGYGLHTNYHRLFSGPKLPESEDEAFRVAVMSAAGVVPRNAVDVSRPWRYREVTLSDYNHSFLSQPKTISIDRADHLARFFAEYAAKQGIVQLVDDSIINEFLDRETTQKQKKRLASFMLSTALDISLEGLNQSYYDLKKEGYLNSRSETFRMVTKRLVRCHSLKHFSQTVERQLVAA